MTPLLRPFARRTGSKHPHPNIVQVVGAWEARDGKLLVVMGAHTALGTLAWFVRRGSPACCAEFMAHSLRVKRTVNKVRRWCAPRLPARR